jgi:hypothetical protein
MKLDHQDTKTPREGIVKSFVPSCLGGEPIPAESDAVAKVIVNCVSKFTAS